MCAAAEGVSQVTINYIQFTVSTPYRLKYLKAFIFIFLCLRTPVKTRNSYWKLTNRYIKRLLNSFLLEFSFPNEFCFYKGHGKTKLILGLEIMVISEEPLVNLKDEEETKSAFLEYQEKELESGLV